MQKIWTEKAIENRLDMIEVKSKVDADTVYKIFDNSIAIHRDGDAMKIAFVNLNSAIKRFRQDIQDEILEIVGDNNTMPCKRCGKLFIKYRHKMYCGEKCKNAAQEDKRREKRKEERRKKENPKDLLSEINTKAKSMGLSYGQYQARKYLAAMRGE